MCCFIVGLPLDVGFEMDLEADVAIWRSDINLVMLEIDCMNLQIAHGN
jgi:hypothetical protein